MTKNPLKLTQLKSVESRGSVIEHKLAKSINLAKNSMVFFDEETDLFRIFIFTEEKIDIIGTIMNLEILDKEFEVVDKMQVKGLDHVSEFKVLGINELYILTQSARHYFSVECSRNFIVDVFNRTVARLVEEDGRNFIGTPILTREGQYVAYKIGFRNDFGSHWGRGIFVSNSSS